MAATAAEAPQQPAADKVRQLFFRRLQVQLQSGRVIEGDFVCLDPQGNIILANASEHIKAAQNGSSNSSSLGKSSNGPALNHLGMVLVPKAQHKEVLMEVTLSEKASVMSLVGSS
eukprot:GHUV01010546.1.p1 GENE.GHUV01010546.1~~GHUV01010546.1.p1  ORF type:complete len:115 (+),score=45.96 GHUV01010546.1:274-618(+)